MYEIESELYPILIEMESENTIVIDSYSGSHSHTLSLLFNIKFVSYEMIR